MNLTSNFSKASTGVKFFSYDEVYFQLTVGVRHILWKKFRTDLNRNLDENLLFVILQQIKEEVKTNDYTWS